MSKAPPELVREWRLARGWNRERMAVEANLCFMTIQRFEKGKGVRLSTLRAIAALMNVPVSALVDDDANAAAA